MIITSEHDFSSANTYIHLGYASAQNWNVAMHEMTWPASPKDLVGEEGWGGVCSHCRVMSLFMMWGGLVCPKYYTVASLCGFRDRGELNLSPWQLKCDTEPQLRILKPKNVWNLEFLIDIILMKIKICVKSRNTTVWKYFFNVLHYWTVVSKILQLLS